MAVSFAEGDDVIALVVVGTHGKQVLEQIAVRNTTCLTICLFFKFLHETIDKVVVSIVVDLLRLAVVVIGFHEVFGF